MAVQEFSPAEEKKMNKNGAPARSVSLNKAARKAPEEDVLYTVKEDRRLLSHVPDKTGHRSNRSRRGASADMASEN